MSLRLCALLSFVLVASQTNGQCLDRKCCLNNHDFSPLNGTWHSIFVTENNVPLDFHFSICSPMKGTCSGQAVCFMDAEGGTVAAGSFELPPKGIAKVSDHEFAVNYTGAVCRSTKKPRVVTIIFSCGKTLGRPTRLNDYAVFKSDSCVHVFYWKTSVACSKPPSRVEKRCYTYSESGKLLDLSPLIMTTGAHNATGPNGNNDYDYYINPCSSIKQGRFSYLSSCDGASFCMVPRDKSKPTIKATINTNSTTGLGRNLMLTYTALEKCKTGEDKRRVMIAFVCPTNYTSEIGVEVTSNNTCDISIQYRTEFACAADRVTNHSCMIKKGNEIIDLSRLAKSDSDYSVEYKSGNEHYVYRLNLCRELSKPCKGKGGSMGCQAMFAKNGSQADAHNIGQQKKVTLTYADGKVSMRHEGGDHCSSKFSRTTVINFVCNQTAGNGKPKFDSEEDCVYVFTWQTDLVCQGSLRKSCSVTDGSRVFDLSRLTRNIKMRQSNWQVIDTRESNDYSYFINVCDELVHSTTPACPDHVYACQLSQEGKVHKSLGKKMELTINSDNTLKLNYSGGDVCSHSKTARSVVITLVCSPGLLVSSPEFVTELDDCTYEFVWYTAAACPVGTFVGRDCTVYDMVDGFLFNLTHLSSQTFHTSTPFYKYDISVCSALKGSTCIGNRLNAGVCRNSSTSSVLGQVTRVLEYRDGSLFMTLRGGDMCSLTKSFQTTRISFLCDPHSADNTISVEDLGSKSKDCVSSYNVIWKTQYACHAKAVPCVTSDGINKYDLSKLALAGSNWQADDNREDADKDFRYFINVCRSLNPVHGCSPLASACQTHKPNEHSNAKETGDFITNLGEPAAPLYNKELKRLELNYTWTNGRLCHKKYQRKTHIRFLCDPHMGLGSPKFVEETQDCVYIFEWTSSAACPLKDTVSKEFCRVTQNNYTYDLTPLMKNDSDYQYRSGQYDYRINVCRNLTQKCNSDHATKETAVCQTSLSGSGGHSSYPLGKANTSLVMGERSVTLTYSHGLECHNHTERKTVIEFICDRSNHNASVIKSGEASHCSYVFQMATPLVCPPSQVPCVAHGLGGHYDLSPLTKLDGHWTASSGDSHSHTFYINVCRSIDDTSRCRANTGTCQLTPGKSFNAGYVLSSPVVVGNGMVILRYQNGDICHKKYPRSTTIKFSCGDEEGEPLFERETPYCEYIFTWQTKYACPRHLIVGRDCAVTDVYHETPYKFDFSRLGDKSYILSLPGGSSMAVQVCKPVASVCSVKQAGACIQTGAKTVHYGAVNSNVTYFEGELILNYTKGAQCQVDSKRQYYTVIVFRCNRTDMRNIHGSGPKLLPKSDDCGVTLEWYTPLACPPQQQPVDCTVYDSDPKFKTMFDLSTLTRLDKPWTAVLPTQDHAKQYYINVCAPLTTNYPGTRCNYSAGVCEVVMDGGKVKSSNSLGQVKRGPYLQNHEVYVEYVLGDKCNGVLKQRKAIIHFHCRFGQVGSPEFTESDDNDCIYRFDWFTEAACPSNNRPFSPLVSEKTQDNKQGSGTVAVKGDCTTVNPFTGHKFNLLSLKDSGDKVVKGADGHTYALRICESLSSSKYLDHLKNQSAKGAIGAAQLSGDGRYFSAGQYSQNLKFVHNNVLELVYSGGDTCHKKYQRSTVLTFVCNKTAGVPKFQYESDDCAYNFQWKTPLACESQFECSTTYKGKSYDLSSLVGRGDGPEGNWEVSINDNGNKGTVFLQLCQAVEAIPKNKCPASAGACLVTTKDGKTNYMNIGEPTSGPKFEEGVLSIMYTNGEENTNCAVPKAKMQTVIKFVCKESSMGGVQFLMFDRGKCSYVFNWETPLVCSQEKKKPPAPQLSCDYTDQLTNTVYSLKSLKSDKDLTVLAYRTQLVMNMCQGLQSPPSGCSSAAMVCVNGKNVGSVASLRLFLEPVERRLRMELQGDTCGSGKYRTTIYFNCVRTAGRGRPVLELADSCHYMLTWDTNLACPPSPDHCILTVKNGTMYDLEYLSRGTSEWSTDTSGKADGEIFLNVCDAVKNVKLADQGCGTDAAVCLVKGTAAHSLGSTSSSHLALSRDGKVVELAYTNGYKCHANPPLRAQTMIQFTCDEKAGRGKAVLESVSADGCKYIFSWRTVAACSCELQRIDLWFPSCQINEDGNQIDLSALNSRDYQAIETRQSGSTVDSYVYYLSPCGALHNKHGCSDDASVCQTKRGQELAITTGDQHHFRVTVLSNGDVEMRINGTESCHHAHMVMESMKQTIIQFSCSTVEKGPVFVYESNQCHYVFDWQTPVVCGHKPPPPLTPAPAIPNQPDNKGGKGSSSSSSSSHPGKVVGIIVLVIVICVILLVIIMLVKSPQKRAAVYRKLTVCHGSRKAPSYQYIKLSGEDPEEETSLLEAKNDTAVDGKDKNDDDDDEDDDDLLDL